MSTIPGDHFELDEATMLCGRIADGEATGAEWQRFVTLADRAPRRWRDLALTQRQTILLAGALDDAVAEADRAVAAGELRRLPRRLEARAWAGWAVAALLALAWVTGLGGELSTRGPRGAREGDVVQAASMWPTSPAEALSAYIEEGRRENTVVGEVPTKVIVNFWPATEGEGYEVLYLRQILERRVVPELYEVGATDEAGAGVPVRYDPRPRRPM